MEHKRWNSFYEGWKPGFKNEDYEKRKQEHERVLVRERIRAYREKHKEELVKAHRVATKLMTLRTASNWLAMGEENRKRKIEALADTLLEFLIPEEAALLSVALVNKKGKNRSRRKR